jgi:hypothetical protein
MKWSLLVVDTGFLIRGAETELARLGAEIRSWERVIRDYEALDLPALEQWKNLVCADLLSRKRELDDELRLLRTRLTAIHSLAERGDWSEGEAYFWFSLIEQDEHAVPQRIRQVWEDVDGPSAHAFDPSESEGGWNGGDVSRDANGSDEADQSGAEGDGEKGPPLKDEAHQQPVSSSLQSIYRRVVRRLHPDVAGTLSGNRLELWHQAQAAYGAGDRLTLELILARCTRARSTHLTYSQLLDLVADARARLEMLQRAANVLAEKPGWRFRECDPLKRRHREFEVRNVEKTEIRDLLRERQMLQQRLRRMHDEAERWIRNGSGRPREMAE